MNQKAEYSAVISENDYRLIKEMIGSAMYFNSIVEYAAMIEDKLRTNTCWNFIKVVEYDSEKNSFINREANFLGADGLMDFYSCNSQVINEAKEFTGAYIRPLVASTNENYEKKLMVEGIRVVGLCSIMQRDKFAGIIAGFVNSADEITDRDKYLLEVAAEILALSLEMISSNSSKEEMAIQVRNYHDRMIHQESLKIMADLTAGIAHDLNNVLAGILGYVQMIESKTKEDGVINILNEIRGAVLAGKETISNLQEVKKVDINVGFELVPLTEVINKAVHLTRSKWQDEAWARNVEYKIEIGLKSSLTVLGNPNMLLECFIMIILKSIETISEGGKITINDLEDSDYAVITFTSTARRTGSLSNIYNPFISVSEDMDAINFSVAREILQRHRGVISLESMIGRGNVITVKIPLMKKKITQIKEHAEVLTKIPARILVVEDEAIVRQLLRDVLVTEGFEITEAANGQEALTKLESSNFDIIITDLGMPIMSGFDLARRVRETMPDIPIILATGWEAHLDRRKLEECRINHMVGKPFSFKDLINSILDCLAKSRG